MERIALTALLLSLLAIGPGARFAPAAEPPPGSVSTEPVALRVLWWRGDRVYFAALDSTVLASGTRLTVLDGRKRIAAAQVFDRFERDLVVARLTSGSLDGVKRPERLRVLAEAPASGAGRAIRIGYARAPRATPFWSCDGVARSGSLSDRYRLADSTGARLLLVRRESVFAVPAPWPDTVVVRLFDDEADVEIALERGDLDAGVFWPGEASRHIRDAMRWNGTPAGVRSRGVVTIDAGGDASALASMAKSRKLREDLAALNREYFRGDLLPLAGPASSDDATVPSDPIRYVVRGPYGAPLESFLNHGAPAPRAVTGPGVVSIAFRDEPPDSIGAPGQRGVFAVRCPIIAAPGDRGAIEALGADALVNFFRCSGGSER